MTPDAPDDTFEAQAEQASSTPEVGRRFWLDGALHRYPLTDCKGALIVAELKVVEDDGILVQGIDYYSTRPQTPHSGFPGFAAGVEMEM